MITAKFSAILRGFSLVPPTLLTALLSCLLVIFTYYWLLLLRQFSIKASMPWKTELACSELGFREDP